MRILHVDHSPVLGGAERSVYELVLAQRQLGHEVAVAVGQRGGLSGLLERAEVPWHDLRWPAEYVDAPASAALLSLAASGARAAKAGHRLERLAERWQPDVVQLHTRKSQMVAALTSRLPRGSVLFHFHEWPPQRRVMRAAARLALRRADHAVAVSRAVVHAYRQLGASPRSGRIGVVHSTVSTERLAALDTPWLDGRRTPVIGFVGHIAAIKAPHLLLEAAEQLLDLDVRFRFIGSVWFPAGEADYGRWFEERLAASVARTRIERQGTVATPVEAFDGIDVLVHSSTHPEGFGRVIVEAMAARRPIVAFRLGPVPELVDDETAWLAAAPTASAVADAIRAIVTNPALARQRTERVAARAAQFAPLEVARRMDAEYAAMAARGRT